MPTQVPLNFGDFPRRTLAKGTRWFRCHPSGHRANEFTKATSRFRPDGVGVLYLEGSPETSVLGILRRWRMIDIPRYSLGFSSMNLSEIRLTDEAEVADLTASSVIRWGVNRDLLTASDFKASQEWARAFLEDGLDGIVWPSTFQPRTLALALFESSLKRPPHVVSTIRIQHWLARHRINEQGLERVEERIWARVAR